MKAIIFIETLLIFFGALEIGAFKTQPFKVDPAALYQTYNEIYFNNELPKNIDVLAEEPPDVRPGDKVIAITYHSGHSHWYRMYVSPKLNPTLNYEEESVLHEQCHIEVEEDYESRNEIYIDNSNGHGKPWQDCMKRLANEDAFSTIW